MIKLMSNWAGQIVIAVIIATLLEMILPKSKSKKYVKVVLSIYVLFAIISPIVKNKNIDVKKELDLDSLKTNTSSEINQESMDRRLQQLYIEELEKDVTNTVKSQGYNVEKCKVTALLDNSEKNAGIQKIELTISNDPESNVEKIKKVKITIGEKEIVGTKNSGPLKKFLSEHYEINEDKIIIYSTDE